MSDEKNVSTETMPKGSAERVARLVTELGAGWARYGLTLGRLALQQSARALETTSEILGEFATKIEKAATPKDAPPADAPKN